MATFSPVGSFQPNVMYDPIRVDQAVQSTQRNQLMMENARQDQQFQQQDRDREHVGRVSASLLSLSPAERPAAYAAARRELHAMGVARNAPEQYPGDAQIEALARSAMSSTDQFKLVERRRASEAMMSLFGGGMPSSGGVGASVAPASPGMGAMPQASVPAPMPSAGMYGRNAPAVAARDALLDGPPENLAAASSARAAQSGLPTNAAYRGATPASEGGDWDRGIAQPTGAVPALGGGMAQPVRAQAPAVPDMLPNGLTRQQAAQLAVLAQQNPTAAMSAMGQYQQQNRMEAERAGDNLRAERQFAATQAQQAETNRRANESARLQAEASTRQAQAAERAAAAAGVPSGYRRKPDGALEAIPGGPADKPADTNATEAERKASSYLERMQGAETMLQGMVRGGYDPGNMRDRVAGATPLVGNFLTSEPGQRYLNAAAEWARAKLRLESGAVIGDAEAAAEARTYFPMPGDSQQTIAQKQQLRDTATSAIRRQAGRAAPGAPAAPAASASADRPPLSSFGR